MPTFTVSDDTKYNIVVTATYRDGVKAFNNLQKETESYINFVGIAILFAFMIFIMGKDIIKLLRG